MQDERVKAISRKGLIIASIVTLLMAFIEISGLPGTLFINLNIADISPVYFSLLFNFLVAGLLCFGIMRTFCPRWPFDFKCHGLFRMLIRYGFIGFIVAAVSFVAYFVGLQPFDASPSFGKVLVEGFIYNICVGFIEELYLRGLLLNIIEKLFGKQRRATLWAVIISSVFFGFGHIFGALKDAPLLIISKVVWTTCLGIYFGAIYKKSGNLWVPIILHALINFAAVSTCYSTSDSFSTVSLVIILAVYVLLGVYGIAILTVEKKRPRGQLSA